ncbi:MAG: flagellar hook assembly protein FlgD [Firmicutes bacterium]|nr:flagellar hook assembly protein FlgD [Bacillota bacterium]
MYVTMSGTSAYTADTSDSTKRNELGKHDFLRLLITQLKYQDPMEPVKDHDFIAQLAQFSALEQTENLSRVMAKFVESQEKMGIVAQATALLGKEVVVVNYATGETATGTVSSIKFADGVPQLQVNGQTYFLWEVQAINAAG